MHDDGYDFVFFFNSKHQTFILSRRKTRRTAKHIWVRLRRRIEQSHYIVRKSRRLARGYKVWGVGGPFLVVK